MICIKNKNNESFKFCGANALVFLAVLLSACDSGFSRFSDSNLSNASEEQEDSLFLLTKLVNPKGRRPAVIIPKLQHTPTNTIVRTKLLPAPPVLALPIQTPQILPDKFLDSHKNTISTNVMNGEKNGNQMPLPTFSSRQRKDVKIPAIKPVPDVQFHKKDSRTVIASETVKPAVNGTNFYHVASGDTVRGIARRHGIRVGDLMITNNLTTSNIRIGQKLKIPVSGTVSRLKSIVKTNSAIKSARKANKQTISVPKIEQKSGIIAKSDNDFTPPKRTGIAQFRWPARGKIVSSFGQTLKGQRSDGIDISLPEGTGVKASENGIVIYAGNKLEGFGNLILLRHEDGWVSAYGHNRELSVKRGDKVRRGQIIARSGRTGNAEVPMLHFELRKNSRPINPLDQLSRG